MGDREREITEATGVSLQDLAAAGVAAVPTAADTGTDGWVVARAITNSALSGFKAIPSGRQHSIVVGRES